MKSADRISLSHVHYHFHLSWLCYDKVLYHVIKIWVDGRHSGIDYVMLMVPNHAGGLFVYITMTQHIIIFYGGDWVNEFVLISSRRWALFMLIYGKLCKKSMFTYDVKKLYTLLMKGPIRKSTCILHKIYIRAFQKKFKLWLQPGQST